MRIQSIGSIGRVIQGRQQPCKLAHMLWFTQITSKLQYFQELQGNIPLLEQKALSCFSKSWNEIMIHESPTCGNSCFVAAILGGRDLGNILTSGFLIPGTCGPNWQWHPPESCITHLQVTSAHLCLHSRVPKSRLTGGRTSP